MERIALTKVVAISLWRRPDYTRRILNALLRCDGIGEYHAVISLDGGAHPEVVKAAEEAPFRSKEILPADAKRNCNGNIGRCLTRAFELADYVVHVEDDILLAKDAIRFFEWGRQFDKDARVFSVSAWRHDKGWLPEQGRPKPPGEDDRVGRQQYFTCWGFATWRSRWEQMRRGWPSDGHDKIKSWDEHTTSVRASREEIIPFVSRVQNIGQDLGTHRGDCLNSYWIESPRAKFSGNYRLL